MHSPARHCNRFPIPPHIPGFAAYAFNSKLSTVNFLLTPLSVAFTHFDGGVGVAFHFFHPLPIYPSRGEGLNAHFLAFFVFSSLQTPLLRKAPRSISNFLPLNNLQTPRFATPLFCHPYKTGGCGICRSPWRTAGCAVLRSVWRTPRCRSSHSQTSNGAPATSTRVVFSAIPCLPSAVRCQAQPLARSPQKRDV